MKFFLLVLISYSVFGLSLEGRYIEKGDDCSILINEKELSGKKQLLTKCEMFLVDQYKYKFEIDDKVCPYKVKKVGIIVPGVDAKEVNVSKLVVKCPTTK